MAELERLAESITASSHSEDPGNHNTYYECETPRAIQGVLGQLLVELIREQRRTRRAIRKYGRLSLVAGSLHSADLAPERAGPSAPLELR